MAKPKLRFPEFTNEWEEKQLKDFMFFKNGLNADKDKFGSGIKFISVMDILNNPFITYDVIRGKVDIDEKTLDNYSVTYGDVLFQRSSETREDAGKSNVYLDKENTATFGGFVIRGKKTGDYSPEFMNSLLKSPKVRKEITSKAQGAQHINVGQETLENVSVVLPVVREQERIAEFLSSVDDIIQVQEEKISALEEQKKGALQKLFNREVRFKADNGSEYPEWEEKLIGDLMEVTSVKRVHESDWVSSGIPFYRAREIVALHNGECITPLYISYELFEENSRLSGKIKAGDLLVTGVGTIGVQYLVKASDEFYFKDGNIIWLKNENRIHGKYFYYCYDSTFVKNQIKSMAGIGTVGTYTIDSAKKTRIFVPCLKEQQKIADCLSAYDEVIQIKKDKLEIWKEIKKGLLQQMFV